jgi:hypothetical protein
MNLTAAIGLLIIGAVLYFALLALILACLGSIRANRARLDALAPNIDTSKVRPPRLTNTRAEFERHRTNNRGA